MLLPDGTPDNFADILAQLQNAHVFVSGGYARHHMNVAVHQLCMHTSIPVGCSLPFACKAVQLCWAS